MRLLRFGMLVPVVILCMTASFAFTLQAAPPEVTVQQTTGGVETGPLLGVDTQGIRVGTKSGELTVPTDEILAATLPKTDYGIDASLTMGVRLLDGTNVSVANVLSDGNAVVLSLGDDTETRVPFSALRSVRLVAGDGTLSERWEELQGREFQQDVLVVARSGGVLDFIQGTIGEIGPTSVKFLLNGNELPIKRSKLFGFIFARTAPKVTPLCVVNLAGDQTILAKELVLSDSQLTVTGMSGGDYPLPIEAVRSLDYSGAKLTFLSSLEPKEIKERFLEQASYQYPFFHYQKDRGQLKNDPLAIGDRVFRRGLWIHSETTLQYRIGGDFSRFQAVAGLGLTPEAGGHVLLKISADDEVLFEKELRHSDGAIPLDLDVSGKRDLEIHVGFGFRFESQGDHLILGDAKLLR